MINKNIKWLYDINSAVEFLERCPLTLRALKELFLKTKEEREDYEKNLTEFDLYDDEDSLFRYLNDDGFSDEEVIEYILESLEEEYFIVYVDKDNINFDQNDSYWDIYKLEKGDKNAE